MVLESDSFSTVLEKVQHMHKMFILFPAGSFTYNLNTSEFATKVFVKSLLPDSPHFKLIFSYINNTDDAPALRFLKFNIVRTLHYMNFNGNWKMLASFQKHYYLRK